MRDRAFWETWLRRNAAPIRDRMHSVRDWYRAAEVAKGERRAFRAALKNLGETGRGKKGGKSGRRAGKGPAAESPYGGRGREAGRGRGGGPREGRRRCPRE